MSELEALRGHRLLLKSELLAYVKAAGGRPVCIRCGQKLVATFVGTELGRAARRSLCSGCIDWIGGEDLAAAIAAAYWNPKTARVA